MISRTVFGFIAGGITLFAVTLLVSGSPLLLANVGWLGEIPAGTFISWAGIFCLPLSLLLASGDPRVQNSGILNWISNLLRLAVVLGLVWGLVGFLFAGNWSFNFSPQESFRGSVSAANYFWAYTGFTVCLSVLLGLALAAQRLVQK